MKENMILSILKLRHNISRYCNLSFQYIMYNVLPLSLWSCFGKVVCSSLISVRWWVHDKNYRGNYRFEVKNWPSHAEATGSIYTASPDNLVRGELLSSTTEIVSSKISFPLCRLAFLLNQDISVHYNTGCRQMWIQDIQRYLKHRNILT